MPYTALRLEIDAAIARIILTRPDSLIDSHCLLELADATAAITARDDVIVTLLEAKGDAFGLGWEPVTRDDIVSRRGADPSLTDPFGCLASLACPVIAAIHGEARSAGLELALACDLRLAANDAVFSLPDVLEGRLPLAGASQRLPRIAGRGVAIAMLLAGEALDAAAALRCGLVSRVVPPAELSSAALDLGRRLSQRGPIALRYAKELVHRGLELPLDHALRFETDLAVILQTTADRAEGVRAFLEKRPPRFEGR
jgi:enoyl-CoA hydratase